MRSEDRPVPERGPVGFGRREAPPEPTGKDPSAPFPAGATKLDDDIAAALIPERSARGHKGSFGKLLVIAGSLDYAGAALLVCRAAGRAGVGLVTLAVPESLQPLFAAKIVEATTMALPEDDVEEVDPEPALARILDHEHDALVVGPGLRPGLATTELVRSLLPTAGETDRAPMVLDAEALRAMATVDHWWDVPDRRACVLTPHPGEFARLRAGSGNTPADDGDLVDDDEARLAAARNAAETWATVVVLKGARTVIATPDGTAAIAPFENPALATGGTGDVLAGTVGALLAQGLGAFDAARLGVYLHGLAGDAVRERFGDAGLLASDLPDSIAVARKRLAGIAERRSASRRLGFALGEQTAPPGPSPTSAPSEPAGPDGPPGRGSPEPAIAPDHAPAADPAAPAERPAAHPPGDVR
jgi:ADP-dependent NAD(P)H-hydrate dehydratase / NAD(P)H-hydrate epimerase